MQLSVFNIYMLAWLLAVASVVMSAVILSSTFADVQAASVTTQRGTGMAQTITLNLTVATTMTRMKTEAAGKLAQFLSDTATWDTADFAPDTVLNQLGPLILRDWAPYLKNGDFEMSGYIVNLLYPLNASTYTYDRSVQVYVDALANWTRLLTISLTNTTDNYEYAYSIDFIGHVPSVGAEEYSFDWFPYMEEALTADNFYFVAFPWAAVDGNSYWYFTYQIYWTEVGVEGTVQTLATPFLWLDTMKAIRGSGAEMFIVDRFNNTIVATPQAEVDRLAACRETHTNATIPYACINFNTAVYPTPEIRIPFNALWQPEWNDKTAPAVPFSYGTFMMDGVPYTAVTGTVFSANDLRMNSVWYQPTVATDHNSAVITAVVCILTVLSTLVLSVLGIFGVLLPLMRLGKGLQQVAGNLKKGDSTVTIDHHRSIFTEVNNIGRDFETIVVDFLGFSTSQTRDTACAPKDSNKPFAVVFTDIESSSLLWGRDPTQMARCLQCHNDIIRSLIQKHGLYEVKTVGDSFVITGTSAGDAVQFAIDLEQDLYDFDWQWPGLEGVYQQGHSAFVRSDKGNHVSSYRDQWNGLRVRVGIHYGLGDITYDNVTKGYDYFGSVVNIASRIEGAGHGGQILISQDTLQAMKGPLDSRRVFLKKLGVHPLRGIEDPPSLVEIVLVRLMDRVFPSLRTVQFDDTCDAQFDCHIDDCSGPAGDHSTEDSSINHENLVATAEEIAASHSLVKSGIAPAYAIAQHLMNIRDTLEDVTIPLGTQVQTATLKSICKGWGVRLPKTRGDLGVSLLLVAQRLSESAKSIAHLTARFRSRANMVTVQNL